MQKIVFVFLISQIFYKPCLAQSQVNLSEVSVIPQPVSLELHPGYFLLNAQTTVISADKGAAAVAVFLSELIHENYGFSLKNAGGNNISSKSFFSLAINKNTNKSIGDEGYSLKITAEKVKLSANTPKGLFYGVQTLMQLLPPGNGNAQTKNISLKIPCVAITDYPRFGYRGMMLDVSRHFFSKEFIKKYIDEMAKYKFNVFHWHLTDDHGWRIEIKGLPKLT
jgi:hexosaminidase